MRSRAGIFIRAVPALMLPVLVLGGIYSGIFTPTEAAAVAALYALLVTLVSRAVDLRGLEKIFLSAALSAAAILVIIGFTSIFNRAMVLEQVPQSIAAWAVTVTDSPLVFLLVVNLVLLVVGMFMETNAATLLMGPLLAPTAAKYGIDPIHFAIILVTNIELGLLTPPLAANLYVAARTNKVPIIELLRNLGWFLLASLVVMAMITYVPQLALWYRLF
jgi:C4-dicarboxylate transporter DctM subunit